VRDADPPLEQPGFIKNSHRKSVVESDPTISSLETLHMQVGQCGNQEAHAVFILPQAQGGPRHRCED
jgi:hypothetical protein